MRPEETNYLAVIRRALQGWRRGAPFVAVNFHRVGMSMPSDPFRHLDTISRESFRSTLALLRFFFQVVSLSDVVEGSRQARRPRLILTFDDVSRTFLSNALPLLEQYNFPVTLFPCVRITETGSGWRDLVYYLMDSPDLHPVIRQRVEHVLGKSAVQQLQKQGIYKWTKSLDHQTALIEKEILLPALGERHRQFEELVLRQQPYLNWSDLKKLAEHPLVTIGSHGTRHHDYRGLSSEEIRRDVSEAQECILHNLGFQPQHFSLPFGSHDQRVWQTLDKALPTFGIKTAFWCERMRTRSIRRITGSALVAPEREILDVPQPQILRQGVVPPLVQYDRRVFRMPAWPAKVDSIPMYRRMITGIFTNCSCRKNAATNCRNTMPINSRTTRSGIRPTRFTWVFTTKTTSKRSLSLLWVRFSVRGTARQRSLCLRLVAPASNPFAGWNQAFPRHGPCGQPDPWSVPQSQ